MIYLTKFICTNTDFEFLQLLSIFIYNIQESNTYNDGHVCPYICPFQSVNHCTYFDEFCYEYCATRGHHTLYCFNSLQSVITVWNVHEIVLGKSNNRAPTEV
jgi:hypothetical protein